MSNVLLEYFIKLSEPVCLGFDRIEPRSWGAEGNWLELIAEIGSLARAITLHEGYRHGRKSRHQLADELSDVLFVLIKIIREEALDAPQTVPVVAVQSPEGAVQALADLACKLSGVATLDRLRLICQMVGIIGWLAAHYRMSLVYIHREELELAATWQKLFFNSGRRMRSGFLLKARWAWYRWCHIRNLDQHYY